MLPVAVASSQDDDPPIPEHTLTAPPEQHGDEGGVADAYRHPGSSEPLGPAAVPRIDTDTVSDDRKGERARQSGATDYPELLFRDPHRYDIVEEHGRGGIGRVFRARDKELDRTVAIKELQKTSHVAEARFVREAMITSKLQHPGIVPIHEAGRWPDGTPFYAMKLVEGESLRDKINACSDLQSRLALLPQVIAVADAVAYAHSKQVVHRDLKPSNVVVGDFGETVVIDWGLAKDLKSSLTDDSGAPYRAPGPLADVTSAGAVVGTPAYMPPEQARGAEPAPATDIYALGAILYHVCSGAPPFAAEQTGPTPRSVLDGPPQPLQSLVPELPAALASIAAKAMNRSSEARYSQAAELADDLRRFGRDEVISAHRYTRQELVGRWLSRHRLTVRLTLVALMLTVLGSLFWLNRVAEQRDRVERQREKVVAALADADAERDRLVLLHAESSLETDPTASLAWLKQYHGRTGQWQHAAAIAADAIGRGVASRVLQGHNGRIITAGISTSGPEPYAVTSSTDGTLRLWDLSTGKARTLLAARSGPSQIVVGSGGQGATATFNKGHLTLVQLPSGQAQQLPTAQAQVQAFRLSPDARKLAVADLDSIDVWEEGRLQSSFPFQEEVYSLRYNATGTLLAILTVEKGLFVVRLGDEAGPRQFGSRDAWVLDVAFQPNSTTMTALDSSGQLRDWDVETRRVQASTKLGAPMLQFSATMSRDTPYGVVGYSDDGALFFAKTHESYLSVHSAGSHIERWRAKPTGYFEGLTFVPASHQLAYGSEDGTVVGVDPDQQRTWRYRGHLRGLATIAFSADGKSFISGAQESEAWIWDWTYQNPLVLRGAADAVFHAVFTGDSRIVADGRDGVVRSWSGDGGPSTELSSHQGLAWGIDFSASCNCVATASWDGTVRVHELGSGKQHVLRSHKGVVETVKFSPDGKLLVSGGDDGALRVWRLGEQAARSITKFSGLVVDVSFDRTGHKVFAVGEDGQALVWDLDSDQVNVFYRSAARLTRVQLSRTGRFLAISGKDNTARLFAMDGLVPLYTVEHAHWVSDIAFSAGDRYLATASRDTTVQLLDLANLSSRTLRGHTDWVRSAVFSPDADVLATTSQDNTVRVWDLARRTSQVLRGHTELVVHAAFSPDGRRLATSSWDKTVRLWTLGVNTDGPPESSALHAWLAAKTDRTLHRDRRSTVDSRN